MAAEPIWDEPAAQPDREVLIDVRDLKVHFPIRGGFFDRMLGRQSGWVRAVDGVTFQLHRGEVLGFVGESGSGKTTLGRALLGLVDASGGSITYDGRELVGLRERDWRPLRKRMQMVFQDPHASLNPAMDLATGVGHPLKVHGVARDRDAIRRRVSVAFEQVGLTPPDRYLDKYPTDLSGGQKQRAVLARATILNPDLLVADEPVSMLDMSVRAKILELMVNLKNELGLTYVYITHDLATAKFFCDRIAIMYLGRIVEIGPSAEIYRDPKHPYTRSLLRAIPEPDPTKSVPRDLPRGEVPDAARPPLGCHFHPRCPNAFDVCGWESRDLAALLEQHWVHLPQDRYDEERAVVGDMTALDTPTTVGKLSAGRGRSGADVVEMLRRIHDADVDEPFWRGVHSVAADGNDVVVQFRDGVDPRLESSGAAEVACHLYNEHASLSDERSEPTFE